MRQALSCLLSLVGAPVVSTPHRSLNSSKDIVYVVDFVSLKEEDILWELQTDGVPVSHVYHFLDRLESFPVDYPKLLLTFNIPHPPSHVYLGFTKLDVRHYYPSSPLFSLPNFWPFRSDVSLSRDVFPLW